MTDRLAALLTEAAEQAADRVALVDTGTGRHQTWAELDREVDSIARGLSAMRLVAGHRVAIALVNRAELVITYLATLRAGLVAVPVDPRAGTGELVRLLADCGARVVVADRAALTSTRQAVAGLEDALAVADDELRDATPVPRVVTVAAPRLPGELGYDQLPAPDGAVVPVSDDPDRLAVLVYSRRATPGRSRAVMLSRRSLLAAIDQVAAVRPAVLTAQDVVLAALPLFHVAGLTTVLGQVLRRRCRLVLVDDVDAWRTGGSLDVVADQEVTVLPVAPPVLEHWQSVPDLQDRLRGVRLVLSGTVPGDLVRSLAVRTGIEVHWGYGLPEAGPLVTSTLCSSRSPVELAESGSVGAALPGVEVRLVDGSGQAPQAGDVGEVLLRGPALFHGYWPDGTGGPDAEGWFATGDLASRGDQGDLVLRRRRPLLQGSLG